MNISIQDHLKSKFRNGAICPHCGSKDVNKFGFFKGIQRYRCKECKKTFNLYTKTLLSWSHYKDKWEKFIITCKKDLSLRKAEQEVGVSYSALFYWRHKLMTILDEKNADKFHGTLELMNLKLKYLDKYHGRNEGEEAVGQNIFLTFLYQRNERLESYIYKENKGAKSFIYDLADNIDQKSIVCLNSNYPFRYHLLYKNVKLADKKSYKRIGYFNTYGVRKYINQFRYWIKMFRGVSSKNLIKYSTFFKTQKVFNNMEYIILSSLCECGSLTNECSVRGALGW